MTPLSFYSVSVLMLTAFLIAATGFKKERFAYILALFGSLSAAVLSSLTLFQVFQNGVLVHQIGGWPAPFSISIVVDQFSVILVVLASVIGFLAIMFSKSYIKEKKTEYYALICLVLAGLLGILQTGDIFNMFVFFEVMNVSCYALVAFYKNRTSLEASIKYLLMGAFATSLMLFGISLLYGSFGTLNLADIAVKASGYSGYLLPVALGLLFTGFAIKAGLVPFHTWLPDAHPAAPSPISAILSGLVVKGGLYAILRIGFTVFSAPQVMLNSLVVIGILSMVTGGVLALMQSDLKRLLAYSTISQMGYIALAFGVGTQIGISGGIFHLINHAVTKSLLFLCAGAVIHYTKTSNMHKIAGSLKTNPILTYTFLIGVLSLGGIPFLNGFASKWLIYIATLQVNPLLTIFTLIITAMTLAYGLKAFYMVFMSNPGPGSRTLHVPLTMSFVLVVLAGACIILGLVPAIGYYISDFALQGLNGTQYIRAVLG